MHDNILKLLEIIADRNTQPSTIGWAKARVEELIEIERVQASNSTH